MSQIQGLLYFKHLALATFIISMERENEGTEFPRTPEARIRGASQLTFDFETLRDSAKQRSE